MTITGIRKLKKIIIYCLSTFFIFSFSLLLMISYEFYVKIVNDNKDKQSNYETMIKKELSSTSLPQLRQRNIERLEHAKIGYKEKETNSTHIFMIDVLKIDTCKYILIHSHIDKHTDIVFTHANDCATCTLNDKKYHDISKQVLAIITKKKYGKR
jgi:uncharacterized protein (UPF0248 family)